MADVGRMTLSFVLVIFTAVICNVFGADKDCKDVLDNCEHYGKYVCKDFKPWAQVRCSAYCEFCQGPVTSPRPCVDMISNCYEYQGDVCSNPDYHFWARDHCYKYCKFCTDETHTTTSIPTTTGSATLRTPPHPQVILTPPPLKHPPIRTPPPLQAPLGKRVPKLRR